MQPTFKILYVLALPDWEPNEVTPFQGFAPQLPYFSPMIKHIVRLPPDIIQPTLDPSAAFSRQREGDGAWLWTPINVSTLISKMKPQPLSPYMVVMSADEITARRISSWRSGLHLKPIHLTFHKVSNAIDPTAFSREQLRQRLIQLAKRVGRMKPHFDVAWHFELLKLWQPEERRTSSLVFHSHGVTLANEMTLVAAGEAPSTSQAGRLNVSPHDHYVQGITQSSEAVMAQWEKGSGGSAHPFLPEQPDIILVAPAMYRGITKKLARINVDSYVKAALRKLERQRDYTLQINIDEKDMDRVSPILAQRGAEIKFLTAAVGLRAAGTQAATIRLPPNVNRTAGVVNQLSRFLRQHEDPPRIKSARVFGAVQKALLTAIPPEHVSLITRSTSGIKIVADAPLEWLPINGLPLGIRFDVSRINTTPGNLFVEQIRPHVNRYITPEAFRNYLVLSMFDDGDPIAHYLRLGTCFTKDGNGDRILGHYVSPRTPSEIADALNSFHGPMVVIDSHATHSEIDDIGGLMIGGERFDVWNLVGKVNMPPIVVLSACDTHPFDRSHASVANGFLACGAKAVVATALPIRAPQAARFVMRLINRAVDYGTIVTGMGHVVPWSNIVGGVLRMELATDILRGFESDGAFDQKTRSALLGATNRDLNPMHTDWFERLRDRIIATGAVDVSGWEARVPDLIAASDTIRYIHLGNPEAIILSSTGE